MMVINGCLTIILRGRAGYEMIYNQQGAKRWVGCDHFLLYRYWWNTRISPFTKKLYLHRAQLRYYFYLSRVRILVWPWLPTELTNDKRASRSGARSVEVRRQIILLFFIRILTFSNRKCKYYFLYFSFITLYPSFITFLWHAFCNRWPLFAVSKMNKQSCLLCGNFISIYIIIRTLHGR